MTEKKKTVRIDEELIKKIMNIYPKGNNFTDVVRDLIKKAIGRNKYEFLDAACPRLKFLEDCKYYCVKTEGSKRVLGVTNENAESICDVCNYLTDMKEQLIKLKDAEAKGYKIKYAVCANNIGIPHPTDANKIKCRLVNYGRTYFDVKKCLSVGMDNKPCKHARVKYMRVKPLEGDK